MPYQAETPVEVGKFMGIIARVRLSESADVLPLFHLHDHLPTHACFSHLNSAIFTQRE